MNAATQLVKNTFWQYKTIWLEGALATVLINLVALATSLFSMQVYDRVIPTQGYHTLLVLCTGVLLAITFELLLKITRSKILEYAVVGMDSRLSQDVFARVLGIRLDQLPQSVGTLTGQMRSYEGIRVLLTASTAYVLVDVPFALVFIAIMGLLGAPVMALVPLFFLALSLLTGVLLRSAMNSSARDGARASYQKTGLLVEAVEGADTIQANRGCDWLLARWRIANDQAMRHDLHLRRLSEWGNHFTASFQQFSYAGLIAVGAWQVMEGNMTMGALMACAILSGRALTPAGMLPALMVQYAHAKAALSGLDKVYALAQNKRSSSNALMPDAQALQPQHLQGHYHLEDVQYTYPQGIRSASDPLSEPALAARPVALYISSLRIQAGQKIAILGPIGSGKSTLLRLLSGLYQPSRGRVLLDDLALNCIDQHCLAAQIGYVQQDHRLIEGTLRDNLRMGLTGVTDDDLMDAARQTGLVVLIRQHPLGLDLPISEGGKGLSGGQRQLTAMTRLILAQSTIWLLDEPTASMDSESEQRCVNLLKAHMTTEQTVVIVTHKPTILPLVDRVIVMNEQQVVMDGMRDSILQELVNRGGAFESRTSSA